MCCDTRLQFRKTTFAWASYNELVRQGLWGVSQGCICMWTGSCKLIIVRFILPAFICSPFIFWLLTKFPQNVLSKSREGGINWPYSPLSTPIFPKKWLHCLWCSNSPQPIREILIRPLQSWRKQSEVPTSVGLRSWHSYKWELYLKWGRIEGEDKRVLWRQSSVCIMETGQF